MYVIHLMHPKKLTFIGCIIQYNLKADAEP